MNESNIVKTVNDLFMYARDGIRPERKKWLDRYKYWKAEEEIKRPSYKDRVRIPLIFEISDGMISVLTDNNPKFQFRPQGANDVITADYLNQILGDYYWDILHLSDISERVLWWAQNISGSGLAKIGIDPITQSIYVEDCNSFSCFPDPCGKSLNTLEFFIYMSIKSKNDLKRIYGERGAKIEVDNNLSALTFEEETAISPWARASGKSEQIVSDTSRFLTKDGKKEFGRAIVLECWMKDDTMEKIPYSSDETESEHEMWKRFIEGAANQIPQVSIEENHPEHINAHVTFLEAIKNDPAIPPEAEQMILDHIEQHNEEPQDTKRLKYPKGKIVTIAGKTLLDERAAPFGLPYAKVDFIIDPLKFWGVTLQQYIQSLQDNRVRRKNQISDNADRTANLREFYHKMSGYDPTKVKGVAGESIALSMLPAQAIYQEQPRSLPPYILQDAQDSEMLIEKIAGWHEVMQGIMPKGSPSGVAIGQLKESLGPRLRKATRHFDWFLTDLARKLIDLLEYEDPTTIFDVLDIDDQGNKVSKQISVDDFLKSVSKENIRVVSGSTLPTSRMEKANLAIQYMQYGIYDQQAALTYLDDPLKDEIIQRTNREQQYQTIIQQMEEKTQLLEQIIKQKGKQNAVQEE